MANWKRSFEPKKAPNRGSRNYLSTPESGVDLLPDGPLRQALRSHDFEVLAASDLRAARALGAWFKGQWVRAYTEADIESLAHPNDQKIAELKRQISAQATIFAKKSPRPTVSVCMIVRNNEASLERTLKSVAPIADQFVIVDTGSTDRTIEIAQKFTDVIHHFTWIDDFGAARNETLKHATGDWVLSIDSDETMDATSIPVVRGSVHDFSCIYSPLQYTGNTASFGVPRLFPRRPEAHWVYPLHEQIYFDGWDPMVVSMSAFLIRPEPNFDRSKKHTRNMAIIERMKLGSEEDRKLAIAYETFEIYREDPDNPDLEGMLKLAADSVKENPSGMARRTFMLLSTIYGKKGKWEDLKTLAETGEAHKMGGLWSKYALARVAIINGDPAEAVRQARAGLAFRDFEGPVMQIRGELATIIKSLS